MLNYSTGSIRQSEEILKNNEKIKSQENELEELFSQWVDVNDLLNDAVMRLPMTKLSLRFPMLVKQSITGNCK